MGNVLFSTPSRWLFPFISIWLGCLILLEMKFPSYITKFFEGGILAHLRKICYSAYLWHMFICTYNSFYGGYGWVTKAYFVAFGVLLFATVSYHLIEKPCFKAADYICAALSKIEKGKTNIFNLASVYSCMNIK